MPKVDVLQLVDDLSLSQADQTIAGRYYDDLVDELSRQQWFTTVTLLQSQNGVATYTPPADAVDVMAVFYNGVQLSSATLQQLELVNRQWRDELGEPIAFITDEETGKAFTVYPKPDSTGGVSGEDLLGQALLGVGLLGGQIALGATFPENAVGIIYGGSRADVLTYMELPLAFSILTLEFSRESEHKNTTFAGLCGQIAEALFRMVR